jgi:nicotinate-nucleotide--dimethylbenzimidazole phosphoribosyltransferase
LIEEREIRRHLDGLAKPPGSLGRLEEIAVRLCRTQETLRPLTSPRRLVLFAGDHGVVARGVSAWPSSVTGLMIRAIAEGRSASAVLARQNRVELRVVDVGSRSEPLPVSASYRDARVRAGTRDLSVEPALTNDEYEAAFRAGAQEAELAVTAGCRILMTGEMGIGNTTPASCITALLTNRSAEMVVGRGAGIDDEGLARKRAIVEAALQRYRGLDMPSAIEAMGGLEIAAMAGFLSEATRRRQTVLLDGFVATAAALIIARSQPDAVRWMIAAHRSAEPGHAIALDSLGLEPILSDWRMRLGEGTGALTALPLLDSAAAVLGMGTLAEVLGS